MPDSTLVSADSGQENVSSELNMMEEHTIHQVFHILSYYYESK